jgi:hypothetical protein
MLRTVKRELTFRIVLLEPPAGVDFGLQMGRGSIHITVQKQRSRGKDLRFQFPISVVAANKGALPDFRGPGVQGRPGERFVYIDIGRYADQTDSQWSRRLKVPRWVEMIIILD